MNYIEIKNQSMSFIKNVRSKLATFRASKVCQPDCQATVQNIPFYVPNLQQLDNMSACKLKCIQALRGRKPFEKVFILDAETDNIIKDFNGDLNSCYIDKKFLESSFVKILHGHVEFEKGVVAPVSFQDFKLLNDNKYIKEIIAYDSDGKESILKKTAEYKHLKRRKFNEIRERYIHYLMEYAAPEDRDKILQLQTYCKTHKNCKAVQSQIGELLTQLQYKKQGVDAIDKFFRDIAPELHLEYTPYQKTL